MDDRSGKSGALGLGFQRPFGLINWRATERMAREILERVGGGIDPETRIFRLSRTERSLVAIARALASNAKLLVLDEPTSSLTAADVDRLFEVLSALKEKGVAMIFVSHRLDEVFRIADRIVVMRDGRVVGACPTSETSPDHLVDLIVGQRLASKYPKAPAPATTNTALDVRDLRIGPLPEVSFRARKGELLALTGLKGAGQREIGRALFGLEPWRGGSVLLGNRPVTFGSPLEAIRNGIGYASANRHDDSLALPLSVRENFFLNPTHRGIPFHRPILPAAEKQEAWRWTKTSPIAPLSSTEAGSSPNSRAILSPCPNSYAHHRAASRPLPKEATPMQSLKSDALEPDLHNLPTDGLSRFVALVLRSFSVYGLIFITLGLVVLFSVLLPGTFFTWLNARLIMSNQAVIALLALAAMIPMVAGKIDISLGYNVVLCEVLAISLQTDHHLPWPLVLVIPLALGAFLGVFNALLVEIARIDSFIATLGTGTVIYAIALWYTNGEQVIGKIPASFHRMEFPCDRHRLSPAKIWKKMELLPRN